MRKGTGGWFRQSRRHSIAAKQGWNNRGRYKSRIAPIKKYRRYNRTSYRRPNINYNSTNRDIKNNNIWNYKNKYDLPYVEDTKVYINENTNKAIWTDSKFLGKGWYNIRVGKYTKKTRNPKQDKQVLMSNYYPNFNKDLSTFTEHSYHQPKSKKITNYGSKDYTLQYSELKKGKTFNLIRPAKTSTKTKFGNVISSVSDYNWNYIVLDWIPSTPIKLKIKHTVTDSFDNKKKIWESKEFPISKKKEVIKRFKDYVTKIKR